MQFIFRFKKIFLTITSLICLVPILLYCALYTTLPAKLLIFYIQLTQPVDVSYKNAENYLLHKEGLRINNIIIKHDLAILDFNQITLHLPELDYALLKNKINYKLNFAIDNINITSNTDFNNDHKAGTANKLFSENIKLISGVIANNSYKVFYNNKPILWGNRDDHSQDNNSKSSSAYKNKDNSSHYHDFKNHLTLDINLDNHNKLNILDFLPAFSKFKIIATIDSKKINWNITAYLDYLNSNTAITNITNEIKIKGQTNLKYYIPNDSKLYIDSQKPVLLVSNKNSNIYGLPSLELALKRKLLTITGNVNLTNGNIHPDKYAKIKISKDIVFTKKNEKFKSYSQIINKNKKAKNTKSIDIFKDIKVDVGINVKTNTDNITFTSSDLITSLKGNLFLKYSETDAMPKLTAQGDVYLSNTNYTLYGNKLNIKHGILTYSNSPIDNPNINIAGERKVKTSYKQPHDNTDSDPKNDQILPDERLSQPEYATVSINISNTLSNPEIKLTSSTPMSEADKISYLLFGIPSYKIGESQGQILLQTAKEMFSDDKKYHKIYKQIENIIHIDEFNFENRYVTNPITGQREYSPTVILGKNFFDDLLIRYGFSTNNPLSHISGEYKIRKNLKVQAQYNSNSGSGADIIYSKETDKLL